MSILIDRLPDKVKIDGIEYHINTDFRTSILFEQLLQDEDIKEEDRGALVLSLFYPIIPYSNIREAFSKIIWFYNGGEILENTGSTSKGTSKKVYDFEYDGDYIYAAFLEQYGIDLQDIPHLHWWKFKALFKSLKEDTEIVKIMGYRSVNVNEINDKKEKERYKRLQRLYKLPAKKERNTKELEEALMRGEIV